MTKSEIRKHLLNLRKNIKNKTAKDFNIMSRLLSQEFYKNAKTIMVYISYNNEVDTISLIEKMRCDKKVLCAPLCIDKHIMEARRISSLDELVLGAYGIKEPTGEKEEHIDLILVPGVAFSEELHRIGYGAGYYDRFLKNFKGVTCGLFYEVQKADFSADFSDIPLDYIITDKEIYKKG